MLNGLRPKLLPDLRSGRGQPVAFPLLPLVLFEELPLTPVSLNGSVNKLGSARHKGGQSLVQGCGTVELIPKMQRFRVCDCVVVSLFSGVIVITPHHILWGSP